MEWTGGHVAGTLRTVGATARNVVRRWANQADYKRWSSPEHLPEWWNERTQSIAELVPDGSRVIEFGAGRRALERFLPAHCSYTPSDLVDRGPGTVICDLNRHPLPDLSALAPDVGVFSGVLEYIRDVSVVAHWLTTIGVRTVIASFDPVPSGLGFIRRYQEAARRASKGYMNHLTEAELLSIFRVAGFISVGSKRWTSQVIWRFQRR